MSELGFTIQSLTTHCLRVPLQRPMRNAFGAINARPALILKVTLADGAIGYGEVFCNFPGFSLFHKARLIDELLAPKLVGQAHASPATMTAELEDKVRRIALQSGEFGPFAQSIAGLDVAVWDALARRADVPLWRLLAPDAEVMPLPAYASGLDGCDLDELVPPLKAAGWRAFKLKVGFGDAADDSHLARLRALTGPDARLMIDANQAWDFLTAEKRILSFAGDGLAWIEEPIPADSLWDEWAVLAKIGPPIALGENLRSAEAFADAIDAGIAVVQPDAIKWGGLSGAMKVAQAAKAEGILWAPHYLAGGVGLAATAHLAMAFGAAYLEVDVNPNPLRETLLTKAFHIEDGMVFQSGRSGHGATPPEDVLARYRAAH